MVLSLSNNVLEVYNVPLPRGKLSEDVGEPVRLSSVDLPGHRSDIRAVALSSDDELLATASNSKSERNRQFSIYNADSFFPVKDILKIWNVRTRSCIRSIECGYALCCSFLPGDRHVGY